jgi:hypothetical protein
LWAEEPLRFAEIDERDAANPRWRLLLKGPDRLAGERTGGQALALIRVPFAAGAETDGEVASTACTSLAYHRGRLEPLVVREQPGKLGHADYVRILAVPPSYPDQVSYRSFRLAAAAPGTAAVNVLLARAIELGSAGESEWSLCLAAAGNSGGDFHAALEPVRIGRRFLAVHEQREGSCGGAHPYSGAYMGLFDLVEGREIALRDWLHPRALDRDLLASTSEAIPQSEPNVLPLSAVLRRLLVRRAAKPQADCKGAAKDASFWTVGVGRDAFLFSPQLGHAVRACAEEISLPFSAMRPFLSAEGKRALALLRADPAAFAPPQ